MTIVEIVFTMIRAALIIAFFMVAIILIRRTFSKAKSEHNREQGKSAYSLGCFNLAESAIHCDGYKHQHINCDTDKIINC